MTIVYSCYINSIRTLFSVGHGDPNYIEESGLKRGKEINEDEQRKD